MKKKFFILLCLCTICIGSAWGDVYTELFTIKSADVVSNTGYQTYTRGVDKDLYYTSWVITFGGNQKSVGTNSGNRSKCNLSSYSKYAVSPVTTSDVASAFVSTASISDIAKISYTFNGGSNQTNTNVYLIYSSDGNTFSQVQLNSGTQGAVISSGTEYEFTKCSGYFGLLFKATNTSGNWRIDDVNITFYKESIAPTEAYTVTFYAGTNGLCSKTELTEASAGAGITLPDCTANTGYVFKGWSTTESGTTPDAGKAGESYKPSSDCTLYAVYNALFTVTIETPENGTLVVKDGDTPIANGESVEDGTTLTIEATPTDGYKFRNWQAIDASTHTYTKGTTYSINAHDVTFKANFDPIPTYTINYYVNGVNTNPQENVYEGTELVFPNVDGIAGKVFCGWVEEAIDGTTDTKPTFVTTTGLTATVNKDYYAVFANKEGEDAYKKVTSAPDDWSGEYLLVYETENVAWTGVDAANCNVAVTISDGKIATKPETAVTLTIATMEGGYSIQVNGGDNNGKYIDQTSYSNGLAFKDNPSANTLSYNENSPVITASVVGTGADEGKRVTMRYNTNADQKRFRYYKSGQQPIQLYLKHGATYSNYCTDISYTRTVNTANIGTLCVPYAFEKPDYMTLYNIVGKDDSKIYFEENTAPIEAGKPYLFRSTAETITLTYTGERAAEAGESNGLVGTYEACPIEANDGNYILSNNQLYVVDGEFNCGANRAYIHIDGIEGDASAAKSDFTLDFNDPTGITSYENDNDNENLKAMTVYNLNGMRVNGSYKGIVVVNGKKFINK